MGFRFRKSVKLFPGVRLNFSARGVSTTLGIPGASVNVGSRGTHLNLGVPGTGLSYRTRILPTDQANQSPFDQNTREYTYIPEPTPSLFETQQAQQIASAEIPALTSSGLGELRRLINEAALMKGQLTTQLSASAQRVREVENRLTWANLFILRIFTQRRIPALQESLKVAQEKHQETKETLNACHIEVGFQLDDNALSAFAALMRAHEKLCACQRIWDITTVQSTNKVAERTIAAEAINRTPVKLGIAGTDIITCRYKALWFQNANGHDLYIYPGFVLALSDSHDFALLEYRDVNITLSISPFIERDPVPGDTEVTGQTWLKTNKDGSPDRRFSDNYQIPIVKYGSLWFRSEAGLNEAYQFSNFSSAEAFARAFDDYKRVLASVINSSDAAQYSDEPLSKDTPDETTPEVDIDEEVTPIPARRSLALDWAALVGILILVFGLAGYVALAGKQGQQATIETKLVPLTEAGKSPTASVVAPAPVSQLPGAPAQIPALVPPQNSTRPVQQSSPLSSVDRTQPNAQQLPPRRTSQESTYVQKTGVNIRAQPSGTGQVVGSASKGAAFFCAAQGGRVDPGGR